MDSPAVNLAEGNALRSVLFCKKQRWRRSASAGGRTRWTSLNSS